jgi:hypothetical protein
MEGEGEMKERRRDEKIKTNGRERDRRGKIEKEERYFRGKKIR